MTMFYSMTARFPVKTGASAARIIDTIRAHKYCGDLAVDIFTTKKDKGYIPEFGPVPVCRIEVNPDTICYEDSEFLENGVKAAARNFAEWKMGPLLMFMEADGEQTDLVYAPAEQARQFATKAFIEHIQKIGNRIENIQKVKGTKFLALNLPTEDL